MGRRIFCISLVMAMMTLLAVLMPPRRATAIPAFSREHGLRCNDCHAPFPLLNEFGMEFKQRGFRLPAQEGKYAWELKSLPVSVIGTMQYVNAHRDDPVTKARLSTKSKAEIEEVELMQPAPLRRRLGFWPSSLRRSRRVGSLAPSRSGCSSAICCRPVCSTCGPGGC